MDERVDRLRTELDAIARSVDRDDAALLADAGWVEEDLARQLADAARFRDLLVHQYADVDDGRAIAVGRERTSDPETFRRAVVARPAGSGTEP